VGSDHPRILVIRLSSMGDIILTLPALEALKTAFPRSRVDVVVKARYRDLLLGYPRVNDLLLLEEGESVFSLAGRFRRHSYDIVVDLHANLRSRLLSLLLRAGRTLRVRKRPLRRRLMVLFHRRFGPPVHTVNRYLQTLRPLGIEAPRRPPRLTLQPDEIRRAERFLEEHTLDGRRPLAGLHPGARWPGKCWPAERFVETGRRLIDEGRRGILVFGGPGEEDLAGSVAREIGPDAAAAAGLPLRRLMALVSRCSVFITNDSGPMHLATALEVPVVAVFGPTHPMLGFWPLGDRDIVLTADLECSPCSLHGGCRCPRDWRCLREVNVDQVLQAAERTLQAEESNISQKKSQPFGPGTKRPAVFLDRDGTINREVHYLKRPEELELLPGAGKAIRRLNDLGLPVILVTNQSGIARGYLTEETLHEIHRLLEEMLAGHGAHLDAIYHCPDLPDSGSRCRKPETGMLQQAAREHGLDLERSYVVGDMAKDIEMGRRAGARTVLVLTGYGGEAREKVQPDHIAADLAEAAEWIDLDRKKT
jgi:heptosyltransferase-2